LAQNLSGDKYEVHLVLITESCVPIIDLPLHVTVHCLGATRIRTAAFALLKLVRRLRPRVILSGMFHLNFLVLLLRPLFPSPVQVLVRQNGTVSSALAFGSLPIYTRWLYRLLYRRADAVICQSRAMAGDLLRETGVRPDRIAILRNPVDVDQIRSSVRGGTNLWTGTGPHLLAVGRLSLEKGFDLLLQALAIVRWQVPGADAMIAGSGPEADLLKLQCRMLGLEKAVRFAGQVDDPVVFFPGATAFVLSSRHEGLPNAMLEAAAAGLPIVALPSSEGITELLDGQPGAWLASAISAEALAATLQAGLRQFATQPRFEHEFIQPFQLESAIAAFEDLIDAKLREHSE